MDREEREQFEQMEHTLEEQRDLLREQRDAITSEHREEIKDEDVKHKGVFESMFDKVVGLD